MRRRANGEGSIWFDEARGKWIGQYSTRVEGKPGRRTVRAATRRELERKMRQGQAEAEALATPARFDPDAARVAVIALGRSLGLALCTGTCAQ